MKNTVKNAMTAKVNKEIGGWDYRDYHIEHRKDLKAYVVEASGDEIVTKSLGQAKKTIDELIENADEIFEVKDEPTDVKDIKFVSKRGVEYLLSITNGVIRAYTYDDNKKITYWSVTKEIKEYMAHYLK